MGGDRGEKFDIEDVKRNYEALIAIGNRKCWCMSLGNMKQVFTLSVHSPLTGGFICLQFLFIVETNLEEMFIVLYQREVDPAVQSSPLALFRFSQLILLISLTL